MSRLEAVIFDWAGTTVDFGCFAPVQAFIEAFREFEIELDVKEVREPMGMRKKDHIKAILLMERIHELWITKHHKPWNEADLDRIYELSEKKIFDIVGDFSRPKPYTVETIDKLRQMKIKIGSTTGYTDEMMKIVSKRAREFGYEPDCWVTPDSTNNMGRPYPYMIFKNMEALKVSSVQKVIKIGDTVMDIKEAKNAGITAIGVIDGSSEMGLSEEEFAVLSETQKSGLREKIKSGYLKEGADDVVDDLRGLIRIVQNLEQK